MGKKRPSLRGHLFPPALVRATITHRRPPAWVFGSADSREGFPAHPWDCPSGWQASPGRLESQADGGSLCAPPGSHAPAAGGCTSHGLGCPRLEGSSSFSQQAVGPWGQGPEQGLPGLSSTQHLCPFLSCSSVVDMRWAGRKSAVGGDTGRGFPLCLCRWLQLSPALTLESSGAPFSQGRHQPAGRAPEALVGWALCTSSPWERARADLVEKGRHVIRVNTANSKLIPDTG